MIEATVIADSISQDSRLTTFVLKYPRFILAELNTHRVLSRSTASSRAIPVAKMLQAVRDDPAMPVYWGRNQPGMQADEELTGKDLEDAKRAWLMARDNAVDWVGRMVELGLHKQIANRVLEPWVWAHTIVTSTEWNNFYSLRCDPAAQPEFKALAEAMLKAHNASTPVRLPHGSWHLPFVKEEEKMSLPSEVLVKLSTARAARVSYLNHDQTKPDVQKDLELHDRLLASGHMSPMEHQARPVRASEVNKGLNGNFSWVWVQYRKTLLNENRNNFDGLVKPDV